MSLERRPLCPKCTDPGNAAIAKAQDLRYWAKRRVREWHIVANKFEEPAIQAFVFGFGTYLEHRFGPAKACLDIEAQVTRLRLLLSRTKNNIAPPKEQLLLLYTHAETRQAESLLDYMATIGLAVPSRPEFLAQSEARRCLTAIAEINEHAGQTHVVTYFSELCSDSRIQPSTRRVAVRAAVELLKSHGWPMTQPAVDRFVRAHRGHYAALGRFLSFLNRHGYELSLPPKQKSRVRKSRSDGFVVCMRQGAAATKFEDLRAATLGILVGYTGFALSDFLSLRREHADIHQSEVTLQVADQHIKLPASLSDVMARYLGERNREPATRSGWLFPGRPARQPVTSEAISLRLKRWGVSVRDLGQTARKIVRELADQA
ncbi:hypothetical protein [Hydrocarboniphaga effusa]|uniref:hypothetical protein n=1 Tax=Hydrocarboniphaga effusa TaxID=243629 RepID=UPI003BABCB1E